MKKFILSFFAVVFVFGMLSAQNLDSKIGNDPNVRIGKLDNGLHITSVTMQNPRDVWSFVWR